MSAGPTGCWPWTGYTLPDGYGRIGVSRRLVLTHRLSYELSTGEIPAGMQIDHICHNRGCCNPQHLRLATQKQNNEHQQGANRRSQSGVRGASQLPSGRWQARVRHNSKQIYLGVFDTAEEAGEAARLKRLELFTHNDVDRSAS